MNPKVNLNSHTQARAYKQGREDVLAELVTALEEGGTVNHLLEVLEHHASPETAARLNAHYQAQHQRQGY